MPRELALCGVGLRGQQRRVVVLCRLARHARLDRLRRKADDRGQQKTERLHQRTAPLCAVAAEVHPIRCASEAARPV